MRKKLLEEGDPRLIQSPQIIEYILSILKRKRN